MFQNLITSIKYENYDVNDFDKSWYSLIYYNTLVHKFYTYLHLQRWYANKYAKNTHLLLFYNSGPPRGDPLQYVLLEGHTWRGLYWGPNSQGHG